MRKVESIRIRQIYFLSIIFFVLNSCDNKQETNHVSKNIKYKEYSKQINFIGHWLNEGKREELVYKIIREYEFLNQDVKVNLKFPEEIYFDRSVQYSQEKFVSDIIQKTSSEWDIIRIEYPPIASYMNNPSWAKDYLIDFSKIPEFVNSTIPYLLSEEYKNEQWGGMLPGPFIEGQYWSLWFNKKVADKLGIEIKQKGMTIYDFMNYCQSVFQYNQNHASNQIVAFFDADDWETTWNLALGLFASQFTNVNEFRAENKTDKLEKWYKVLMVFEEISKFNIYGHDNNYKAWGETNNTMLQGNHLFYINGSWMYNIWESIDSELVWDIVPSELPAFESNTIYPIGYACAWGVPKNAPNKEAAIDFLLHMNSESVAKAWVENAKSPTGIKANKLNVAFGSDHYDEFSLFLTNKYENNSYLARSQRHDILGVKNLSNSTYHREVLKGEMTADEAMELIRSEYVD